MKRPKLKIAILYALSVIVSIVPLIVLFVVNGDKYVKQPSDAVKLTIGGGVCAVFIALSIIGKLKMPRKIISSGLIFILAYLLQPILSDLTVISGVFFCSNFVDYLVFQPLIKRAKAALLMDKQAEVTSKAVQKAVEQIVGRV